MTYVSLTPFDLGLAALLLVVTAGLSLAFRLGLERTIALSALRMCVQLAAVAFVLKLVFESGSSIATAAFALMMLLATAYEVGSRQERGFSGYASYLVGGMAPFLAGLLASIFAVWAIIGADPWWAPRFLLPILGMVIGNALSGVTLVLDQITGSAVRERAAIEARLALGATRTQALEGILRRGLKAGMTPILTAMAVAGVVSLPGMMTGQILAGADPIEAMKYQVMILFLIAGATGIAVVLAGVAAVGLLTDDRHRLRLDRLTAPKTGAVK
ncbi:MAG: ABC transporter permease [Hyphomicrobium sp.]|jgi:putative ABC transport system permease protein|nr:ABC transporter permease [Hyphomicrobium sp.]